MTSWLGDSVSSPVPQRIRRVTEITIIVLAITFYPFGPGIARLVWRTTHDRTVTYEGACITVPSQWFAYRTRTGPVLVRAEAVFARNMFDLGYAQVSATDGAVPFDKYKEALKAKANSEIFSQDGVKVACSDWYESPDRFVNSCVVKDKINVTFAGPVRFRNDFRDLVHTITDCSADRTNRSNPE